jgi:hypothetical protein
MQSGAFGLIFYCELGRSDPNDDEESLAGHLV